MKLNLGPFTKNVDPSKPGSKEAGGARSSLGVKTDMGKKMRGKKASSGSKLSKFAQTLMNLHQKGSIKSKTA